MPRNNESRMQQAFVRWWDVAFRSLGVPDKRLLFAIPNGGARNAVTGAVLKAEGVRRGVPDLMLAVPVDGYRTNGQSGDGYAEEWFSSHGLFLEFKTSEGRVSEEQESMQAFLRTCGYVVAVVRGFDEAERAITRYLRGEEVCA